MGSLFGLLGLAALVGLGFSGAYLIARRLPGAVALIAFLAWLAAPIVVVAVALSTGIDPEWTAEQASYNYAFGTVLVSFLVMLPWVPASVVGAIIGRKKRRGGSGPASAAAPAAAPTAAGSSPKWDDTSRPRLPLSELQASLNEFSARLGVSADELPRLGRPPEGEGMYYAIGKSAYEYGLYERGQVTWNVSPSTTADLFYAIFRDVAFGRANRELMSRGKLPPDYRRQVAIRQGEILGELDPHWAERFALERENPV